jgi:ACS family sodium-dependent inorganic phosphate cotransporter
MDSSLETKPLIKSWPVRYELVGLCALAWFLSYADRVNMSVASIVMQTEFGWTEFSKGIVMAVFFIGYIISPPAGGWLADKFGGKYTLGIAVLTWSFLTLLTPLAASISTPVLIGTRVALGLAEGMAVPATYALLTRWAPATERARMLAIIVMGSTLGAPCAMMLSGWLVEFVSWQSAFYVFGCMGFVWSFIWLWRAHDDPDTHPRISTEEKQLLAQNAQSPQDHKIIPWRKIISHPAVWALLVCKFCVLWTIYIFLAWLPSYFSAVQGVSISTSGMLSAMPWIAMAVMVWIAGWLADSMIARGSDVTFVRKLMQTIGMLGALAFLLMIGRAESSLMAALATSGALGMLAFCYAGADTAQMEVAPRYTGSVTGLVAVIGNIPGVIAIAFTGWLVDTTGSYDIGFTLAAAMCAISLVVWLTLGTAKKVID